MGAVSCLPEESRLSLFSLQEKKCTGDGLHPDIEGENSLTVVNQEKNAVFEGCVNR